MKPPDTPCPRPSALKRRCKTPAPLGVVAARLFGNDALDVVRTDRSNASTSSNGSVVYDQLYLDQCHTWFTRETRASRTPKPDMLSIRSMVSRGSSGEKEKPLRKKSIGSKPRIKRKRLTKLMNSSTEVPTAPVSTEKSQTVCILSPGTSPKTAEPVTNGCVGCSVTKNEEANSSNFFKLLANNVLICSMHRFLTHWILDFCKSKNAGTGDTEFKAVWQPEDEEDQADSEFPFSVTEDRRLIAGVHHFGSDAWDKIMGEFYFAPMRRPEDLRKRWQQLRQT